MAQNAAPPQPGAATPAPPARANRPPIPTRDPHTPGYVKATELPDGAVPPADAYGNFIIGPTHNPAPEMTVKQGVPQGTVHNFTMESTDSKIYPGIAREQGTFGTPIRTIREAARQQRSRRLTRAAWRCMCPQQYVPGHDCAVHRRRGRARPRCCSRRSTI